MSSQATFFRQRARPINRLIFTLARLSFGNPFLNVGFVKLFRIPLLLVLVLPFFPACTTYTHFRVTNHRDDIVAEWTARGGYHSLERGYRITAVERISAPPYRMVTRYPNGWRTNVVGPHIEYWRCPKPDWLAKLDGDPTP